MQVVCPKAVNECLKVTIILFAFADTKTLSTVNLYIDHAL